VRWRPAAALLALAAVVGLTAAACGGGDGGGTTVGVQLTDYEITPNRVSAPAGAVSFEVRNDGGIAHELAVVRTDLAPRALPTTADGRFDEHATGLEVLDRIELAPGKTGSLALDLKAGGYVLACNIAANAGQGTPAHYSRGMVAGFRVTQ
jgi:uncharacterized cupredoxin-like copper-binding protein